MQPTAGSVLRNESDSVARPKLHSSEIKRRARSEGFDKIGIVPAAALEPERLKLWEWLSRGFQGDMNWMARDPDTRTDPQRLFPEARSVVVVALNYYTPHKHEQNQATGKISRYAWGDDYHDIVGSKLRSLLSWIKEHDPATEGKVCVDVQPMMDKAWAVRAGLGWIGKHSNLITQELGSWVFIGELLLNIELDYDIELVEDHCGSCSLCMDACPTNAITEPYIVDSNKCISYATIELRTAELAPDIASNLQGWLYGCDICQDVCPWNKFEQPAKVASFEPRPGNVNADLREVLELTAETYQEKFRRSAMKRTKLAGLQRNARALLEAQEG